LSVIEKNVHKVINIAYNNENMKWIHRELQICVFLKTVLYDFNGRRPRPLHPVNIYSQSAIADLHGLQFQYL